MTNNDNPLQTLLDSFTAASGIQWPEKIHDGNADKWVYPLKEISDYAKDDPELRLRAIREAVRECRQRDIIIANPAQS